MNEMSFTGPCAEYEHDLVDLIDGTLGPEHARIARLHAESCPRCRAWQAEFASIDRRLQAALPQPALSAEFDHRLHARVAALTRAAARSDLRNTADHDYQRLVAAIRRGARRHALLDAIGSVAVTISVLAVARGLLGQTSLLQFVPDGAQGMLVFGAFAMAVAVAALAWSARQHALPSIHWLR